VKLPLLIYARQLWETIKGKNVGKPE